MKRKGGCKCKGKRKGGCRMKSYLNGGMGQGIKAVVHKGEMVLKNPFRRP